MKSIIVAHDRNRVIGREGDLPWAGHMRDDMQHFTKATSGETVIMGRRTYDSLPEPYRPLRNRQNIVLTRGTLEIAGVQVAHNLERAYQLAEHDTYIIGGAEIYSLALPTADRAIITEIDTEVEGGDAFFPALSADEWELSERHEFPADNRNLYPFAFATYLRKHRTN